MSAKKRTLPPGWQEVPVSTAAEINPATPVSWDSLNATVPLYEMSAIDEAEGTLRQPAMVDVSACRSGRSRFRNGDILFARITPCVQNGKSAFVESVPGDLAFGSSEFYVLRATSRALPGYLFYFLRQKRIVDSAVDSFVGTSGRQRVPKTFWDQLTIPLPPLPVQERIVEILRRADEIRRMRREALGLVDAVLAAAFTEMFGDPSANSKGFKAQPLGSLSDVRAGVTKGRHFNGQETIEVPYLRVANVQDGFLDLAEIKTIEVLPGDQEKYRLENGDILMTEGGDPDKLGRGCVWRNQIEGCIHQNHVFRVRTNRSQLTPEYLAALLRTPYAKHYFLSCAKRSSNLASINSTQVKAFQVPVPPVPLQNKFVTAVEQWNQSTTRLTTAVHGAEDILRSLTAHAFTGELTAEWERENAQLIADQQALNERLPQLLLLAILGEKAKRPSGAASEAVVLVTALMKYVFLVQMEGTAQRRVYRFVPYHYGPFAKELYADLDALQEKGLITVHNGDDDKTEIRLSKPQAAEEAIADVPDDLREDVCGVLEQYAQLDHRQLLQAVYEKYPTYAAKSRLRSGKGSGRRRKKARKQ
jgi:type I restriction enzyme S subunit